MKNLASWSALEEHFLTIKDTKLTELFDKNIHRGKQFSVNSLDLYFDYSKNHINQETISLFCQLANTLALKDKIKSLYSGEIVNKSENRAALHTALRDTENHFGVNKDVNDEVLKAQAKTFSLARKFQNKELKNRHGDTIKHLVCLGIGGSYLGPKFIIDSLQNEDSFKSIHFIASIDPNALNQTLSHLKLEECLFFIGSKSFTTLETLSNANLIKQLLLNAGLNNHELAKHFIAATENHRSAFEFGCTEENILPLWDFIGGRFSLWSSIGFPIVVAIGEEKFLELLDGAHQMDRHFSDTPFENNMPFILACLSIWYQNFFKTPTRAVISYDHKLKTFPAFLQQLEMESLGKSVNVNGERLDEQSGAIIWGSEGPNSQHAFHQLLHQGTHLIPCDFLVCKHSNTNQKQQEILFSQCIAQSRALMTGKASSNAHTNVIGNKPSNTLVLDQLSPKTLGALIALHEHKVFVQGVLLDINPFDQWGVELGKSIGNEIISELNTSKSNAFDSSTNSLIQYYKN